MKKLSFVVLMLLGFRNINAQTITVSEYIDLYKDIAISEMKRTGIPASITIAQGILETQCGNSDLVKKSNNHFGIKCKNTWMGPSVFHDDDSEGECFRKYDKAEDSYRDHSNFLRSGSRYAFLFDYDPGDYKSWAYGLKKAGYATNPQYPNILIKNIEENNLQLYDRDSQGNLFFDVALHNREPGKQEEMIKPVHYTEMNTAVNKENIKAGKTLFNGLRAVFVPNGTSILAIATEYNIPLTKLMEYNDLKTDGLIGEEQWLFLEKKLKRGNREFYIAEEGESLYEISQTNAIQLEYLEQYNNVAGDFITKKGTRIRLRPASPNNESAGTNGKIHEVQEKEGLFSIAKKYNLSVEELKQLNSLTGDDLKVGQQLFISK